MFVNGCHIVSSLCAANEEGFSSVVSRSKEIPAKSPGGTVSVQRVERGPFATIKAAIQYAQDWADIDAPPPLVTGTPEPVTPATPVTPADDSAPETSEAVEITP